MSADRDELRWEDEEAIRRFHEGDNGSEEYDEDNPDPYDVPDRGDELEERANAAPATTMRTTE